MHTYTRQRPWFYYRVVLPHVNMPAWLSSENTKIKNNTVCCVSQHVWVCLPFWSSRIINLHEWWLGMHWWYLWVVGVCFIHRATCMAVQSRPVQYDGMRGDMKAALNDMHGLKITGRNGEEGEPTSTNCLICLCWCTLVKSSAPTC